MGGGEWQTTLMLAPAQILETEAYDGAMRK